MNRIIIGEFLDKFFEGSEDVSKKIYTHPKYKWQIWEVEDSMYGFMCEQSEDDFTAQAGDGAFWRSSDGTVLGKPEMPCMIHGKALRVWEVFNDEMRPFNTLLDYLNFLGISTESNLIAAFHDLAKWNDMSVQELLTNFECKGEPDDRTGTD